ncbi:peptide ABC transporter substrate-binding protein [Pilimelia terevasa]|uniref:Peptide ABC transporter substrate-binding protein n=1 Tax=Pilimelia terevasa TaxID=53372 RepID=A0A8J3FHG6_9ACTN|nr:ABC transporter substrate-binding protein [Pilimelia terevasa]GGK14331.1 peptide ABC transporter substrate-binding protein [Pilimelia terevasa]
MSQLSRRGVAWVGTVALALAATACAGDRPGAGTDGAITIYGQEPQNPLVPANTPEVGGGKLVNVLWTGLVDYQGVGGAPRNVLAESIESADAQKYTVRIRPGTTFHDGSPVTAASFVDAWNWGAHAPNGAANSSFYADIAGFADVHPTDPDGAGPQKAPAPRASAMSGLRVVDDTTFEATLAAPSAIWPVKLGHLAFMPLPRAFFGGRPDDFGRNPVGNGPVRFVSWAPDVAVKLTRFDGYRLVDRSKVKDVTVRLYQQDSAGYADLLSGNLDFMEQVPVANLAGRKWETDLADRRITFDLPATHMITFPLYDRRFASADLRRAVSLSIDRQLLIDRVFFGHRRPADSFSNPTARGYVAGECRDCRYDPAAAKAALARAGGFTGELPLFYNADSGHKDWMEAVAAQLQQTLGIRARAEAVPTFAALRKLVTDRKMTGGHRSGWRADYPDVELWLGPNYTTSGAGNDSGYSNPRVDALYREGVRSRDIDAAHARFAEAGRLLSDDQPTVPVFYAMQQSGYSPRIARAGLTPVGELDLATVELR